jgi:protoheme IX farnesyltransferase
MAVVVTAHSPVDASKGPAATTPRVQPAWPRRLVRWLAIVAALACAAALAADALVRFAEPGGTFESVSHAASIGALLLAVGVAAAAWIVDRDDPVVLFMASIAPVLFGIQIVTTELLQMLELSTAAEVADTGLGLLVLGALVATASASSLGVRRGERAETRQIEFFRRVVDVTAMVVLVAAVSGSTVRAVGAGWACQGPFPDCNGLGVLPFGRDPLADIQLYHRLLSYVAFGLALWLAVEGFRSFRRTPAIGRIGLMLLGAALVEMAIGIASVSSSNPEVTQPLHLVGAAALWSTVVVLAVAVRRVPASAVPVATSAVHSATVMPTRGAWLRTLSAYIQLTKPRVMSLLLATTAAAMVIAARGLPDLGILVATLIGGALMSGGAGAINHYVDRDIDPLMGRTAWRPIPSGVISPARALTFGILLAVLASAVFLAFINPTAWVLALMGLLGYVFIYTLWLKRSTPSNIVIGGAAGAIPPLVGWAAVTNEVSSLTAWYLFAIIFFWTPPHFWALSLLIRQHYERAGIPMLPVVRGEDETRRQIVLYSLLLVALSLVLPAFGLMGLPYFVVALALGGLFMHRAITLWRSASREAARSLYLYSMLYLFALFAAMALDRVVSQ